VARAAHHAERAAGLTDDAPYEPKTEMVIDVGEAGIGSVAASPGLRVYCVRVGRGGAGAGST